MSINYKALDIGTVIELEPLMGRLSPENLLLQVVDRDPENVTCDVTYFGIWMGEALVNIETGDWVWIAQ